MEHYHRYYRPAFPFADAADDDSKLLSSRRQSGRPASECAAVVTMKRTKAVSATAFSCCVWAFLSGAAVSAAATATTTTTEHQCQQQEHRKNAISSRYVRIVDGGSTGSRMHTFEYYLDEKDNAPRIATIGTSTHVDTPLSDYVGAPASRVLDHLLPLFVPSDADSAGGEGGGPDNDWFQDEDGAAVGSTTTVIPVYYGATAGMRLVEPHGQSALYDTVSRSLNGESKFARHNVMIDVFTLSGEDEAYYGALAANYLAGVTRTKSSSETNPDSANTPTPTRRLLGALDIGGASTQLVVPVSDVSIAKDNFYCTSLLGYGVDQFQKRLFRTMPPLPSVDDNDAVVEDKTSINPCLNTGFLPTARGNATACAAWMRPLLQDVTDHITAANVSIGTDRHYWAMSLFFFSFDALRHLTADPVVQAAWPTPTLSQLQHAGESLCDLTWDELRQRQDDTPHPFTRHQHDLSKRCFEAVYLVELLRYGMKFTDDHVIHYMFQTKNGDEVEWTLGMAMALRQQQREIQQQLQQLAPKNDDDALATADAEDDVATTCWDDDVKTNDDDDDAVVVAVTDDDETMVTDDDHHQRRPLVTSESEEAEEECTNRTTESHPHNDDKDKNRGKYATITTWTRFLSTVLTADDIFSR